MDEITTLRAWLLSRRGQWTQIASRTGLSTKTIHRIAKAEANLRLDTYTALKAEMVRESSGIAA